MSVKEVFDSMVLAADENDVGSVEKYKEQIKKGELVLSILVEEKVSIPDEEDKHFQLDRKLSLLIDGESIYRWQDQNNVYFGSEEEEWLFEETESSLDTNVDTLIEVFDIKLPELSLPNAGDVFDEDVYDLLDSFIAKAVDEGGDQPPYDFWLVDDDLVAEPFVGGYQVGELPEFDLTAKKVLRLTQEQFDALEEAYYEALEG